MSHTSTSLFIIAGNQDRNSIRAGTQRQELTETIEGAAYWLASCDLFGLLSYRTRDTSTMVTLPTMGSTQQSLFLKCPTGLPGLMEVFSN